MENREHDAVVDGMGELVGMPTRGQRPGLGLAVADHGDDNEFRIVESGAVGVRERVSELATLVDRPWSLRRNVRRNAAGERELPKKPAQTFVILA